MILLWFACPRPAVVVGPADSLPPVVEPEGAQIVGPRYWSEPGGLCLEVPEGFSGVAGDGPELLELTQAGTGFGLQIRTWALDAPPLDRPGYSILFDDPAGYRSVPILGLNAGSRTWLSDDVDGRTYTSWYAPLGERTVEVSIIAPIGRSTEARDALDLLTRSLCTTWLAD